MEKEFAKNVVVAVFNVESEGYQAIADLKSAPEEESCFVSAAALVKKEDGACKYIDGFDSGAQTTDDMALGSLLGMTLGIIGGPAGMLLGGSYGALVGATVDAGDSAFGVSMLDQVADKLDEGMVAIIALAFEESDFPLDSKFSKYDTVIARFDAEAIADEVDRAYEKQAEMARQARIDVHNERKQKIRDELKAAKEKIKEDFQ